MRDSCRERPSARGGAPLGLRTQLAYFAETDEGVAKKAKVALDNGLMPISCVGETLAEREAGKTMAASSPTTSRA